MLELARAVSSLTNLNLSPELREKVDSVQAQMSSQLSESAKKNLNPSQPTINTNTPKQNQYQNEWDFKTNSLASNVLSLLTPDSQSVSSQDNSNADDFTLDPFPEFPDFQEIKPPLSTPSSQLRPQSQDQMLNSLVEILEARAKSVSPMNSNNQNENITLQKYKSTENIQDPSLNPQQLSYTKNISQLSLTSLIEALEARSISLTPSYFQKTALNTINNTNQTSCASQQNKNDRINKIESVNLTNESADNVPQEPKHNKQKTEIIDSHINEEIRPNIAPNTSTSIEQKEKVVENVGTKVESVSKPEKKDVTVIENNSKESNIEVAEPSNVLINENKIEDNEISNKTNAKEKITEELEVQNTGSSSVNKTKVENKLTVEENDGIEKENQLETTESLIVLTNKGEIKTNQINEMSNIKHAEENIPKELEEQNQVHELINSPGSSSVNTIKEENKLKENENDKVENESKLQDVTELFKVLTTAEEIITKHVNEINIENNEILNIKNEEEKITHEMKINTPSSSSDKINELNMEKDNKIENKNKLQQLNEPSVEVHVKKNEEIQNKIEDNIKVEVESGNQMVQEAQEQNIAENLVHNNENNIQEEVIENKEEATVINNNQEIIQNVPVSHEMTEEVIQGTQLITNVQEEVKPEPQQEGGKRNKSKRKKKLNKSQKNDTHDKVEIERKSLERETVLNNEENLVANNSEEIEITAKEVPGKENTVITNEIVVEEKIGTESDIVVEEKIETESEKVDIIVGEEIEKEPEKVVIAVEEKLGEIETAITNKIETVVNTSVQNNLPGKFEKVVITVTENVDNKDRKMSVDEFFEASDTLPVKDNIEIIERIDDVMTAATKMEENQEKTESNLTENGISNTEEIPAVEEDDKTPLVQSGTNVEARKFVKLSRHKNKVIKRRPDKKPEVIKVNLENLKDEELTTPEDIEKEHKQITLPKSSSKTKLVKKEEYVLPGSSGSGIPKKESKIIPSGKVIIASSYGNQKEEKTVPKKHESNDNSVNTVKEIPKSIPKTKIAKKIPEVPINLHKEEIVEVNLQKIPKEIVLKPTLRSRIPVCLKKYSSKPESENDISVSKIPVKVAPVTKIPLRGTNLGSKFSKTRNDSSTSENEAIIVSSRNLKTQAKEEIEKLVSDSESEEEKEYDNELEDEESEEEDIAEKMTRTVNALLQLNKHLQAKQLHQSSTDFASDEEYSDSSVSESNIEDLLSSDGEENYSRSRYDEEDFDEAEEDEYEDVSEEDDRLDEELSEEVFEASRPESPSSTSPQKQIPINPEVIKNNKNTNVQEDAVNNKNQQFKQKTSYIEDTCDSEEFVTDASEAEISNINLDNKSSEVVSELDLMEVSVR